MEKATVYLDSRDYRRLKGLARATGRKTAELIREAVAEYTSRTRPRTLPKSVGAYRSGKGDLAARAEDHLAGMGEDK